MSRNFLGHARQMGCAARTRKSLLQRRRNLVPARTHRTGRHAHERRSGTGISHSSRPVCLPSRCTHAVGCFLCEASAGSA